MAKSYANATCPAITGALIYACKSKSYLWLGVYAIHHGLRISAQRAEHYGIARHK
jgi:hypothetical protein